MSDSNLRERVKKIESRLGRPLRVLHIGNIANNAYINSKLLTELGVESHVLCHDYYHVMGSPEWEDAFFDSNKINHFFPVWRSLDLGTFQRPRWFAQGPLDICLQYLSALQAGNLSESSYLFRNLSVYNRTRVSFPLVSIPSVLLRSLRDEWRLFVTLCGNYSIKDAFRLRFPNVEKKLTAADYCGIMLQLPIYALALFMKRTKLAKILLSFVTAPEVIHRIPETLRAEMTLKFKAAFPDRRDQLQPDDFETLNRYDKQKLTGVLRYYDVIHAYATDAVLPMLCELPNYVPYEHGTIRSYIYSDAPMPRLGALAYHQAPVILCTNADCLPSAKFLRGKSTAIVRGLHGFDERQIQKRLDFASKTRSRKEARFNIPDDICVFFQPARQDWTIKGNDRVLEAIRILKAKQASLKRPFVVVLTEWGNDVARAKAFIELHELEDDINWVGILSKINLIHTISFVDATIDQFLIPCIGAVPAEMLTVANGPVITYLDDQIMSDFYGRTLPVLNAATPEQIAEQMEKVVNGHPDAVRSLAESKAWVREIHSHTQVMEKCLDAYDYVLNRSSADGQK